MNLRQLIERSRQKLGLSQVALARAVGASPRSGQRWIGGQSRPRRGPLMALIKLVLPVDEALARELAKKAGVTIAPPVAKPSNDARLVADAIVCAACDASGLTPHVARQVLITAVARARELSTQVDALFRTA